MKNKFKIFFLSLTLAFTFLNAQTGYEQKGFDFGSDANGKTTRILFIFDCSFSMYSPWVGNENRMEIAKRILTGFMDSLKNIPNIEVAFRCYGHQTVYTKRDCHDTRLEVPFAKPSVNAQKIKDKIRNLKPTGTTPIAYTLEKCADDFPPCSTCKNIIILITDGVEECDGDPCAVSASLQKNNVFLRPFIVGISSLEGFVDAFACMGKFYNVNNPANFVTVLKNIMTEAITQTTVQVNLNDIKKSPSETDAVMTFYDQNNGAIKYDFVHTMNYRGLPDTIIINPDITYKMVVHTIPPVEKNNVTLTKGKHNTIVIDAPQGYLNLQVEGTYQDKPVQAILRKAGDMKTINVQDFGRTEKYIVGKYDLEILTLPRIKISDVEISQSTTKTIKVAGSAMVYIQKGSLGSGSIYVEEPGKFTWVFNLREDLPNELFYLQPGNYRIEYRKKDETDTEKTIEKKFTVKSGQNINLKLF